MLRVEIGIGVLGEGGERGRKREKGRKRKDASVDKGKKAKGRR